MYRHLHRILLVLVIVSVGGCELLGFFPENGEPSPSTVRVVNGADQNVYVMALTEGVLGRILLAPEVEPEDDDPRLLAPNEQLETDFDGNLTRDNGAVFVLYTEKDDGSYGISAFINRSYDQLKRRSFVYTIKPADLDQISLEIHVMNSFENDRVRVAIDGREIFDGRITTDYTVSLAEVIHLSAAAGTHEISVRVNDSHSASTTIDLDEPLYVQVQFYPDDIPHYRIVEGIFFTVTDERPLYD